MTRVIVVSHGGLAEGFSQAVRMIIGEADGLYYLGLEEGEGPESFRAKLDAVMTKGAATALGGTLILADLFGGTPCNQASLIYLENLAEAARASAGPGRTAVEVIAGVNLALLLEAAANHAEMTAPELAAHLVTSSPSTIVDVGRALRDRSKSTREESQG